jgi:hypothetical protein
VNVQSNLRISDACLVASVARSYYTALKLIGDAQRAEALVMEAIESLNPENVTGEALRYAVVEVLVRAQMMSSKRPSTFLEGAGRVPFCCPLQLRGPVRIRRRLLSSSYGYTID